MTYQGVSFSSLPSTPADTQRSLLDRRDATPDLVQVKLPDAEVLNRETERVDGGELMRRLQASAAPSALPRPGGLQSTGALHPDDLASAQRDARTLMPSAEADEHAKGLSHPRHTLEEEGMMPATAVRAVPLLIETTRDRSTEEERPTSTFDRASLALMLQSGPTQAELPAEAEEERPTSTFDRASLALMFQDSADFARPTGENGEFAFEECSLSTPLAAIAQDATLAGDAPVAEPPSSEARVTPADEPAPIASEAPEAPRRPSITAPTVLDMTSRQAQQGPASSRAHKNTLLLIAASLLLAAMLASLALIL